MCAYAMRCTVKHGAHLQPAFHRPPSLFHPLLLFVTKRHVFRCQRVIVAMHHELAVEALQLGHRLSVDHQAALCFFQQASVTGTGPQGADPFRVVCFRQIGQAGQFRLQFAQKFLAMRLLAFCFQVIEADRIAPPSLTQQQEQLRLHKLKQEAEAKAKLAKSIEQIKRAKPLDEQITDLMRTLPPKLRDRPW